MRLLRFHYSLMLVSFTASVILFLNDAYSATDDHPLVEVSPLAAETSQDSFVMDCAGDGEALAALKNHQVNVSGKPATGAKFKLWGWKDRCEWVLATPQAGQYIVSLFLFSGDKRPGKFGYFTGSTEQLSAEFREKGEWSICMKAFRITVPEGQTRTRMFIIGDGIYLDRADIAKVSRPLDNLDGQIKELAASSYRTVLKAPNQTDGKPACVIAAPAQGVEARLARQLAERLKLAMVPEVALKDPFPAFPVPNVTPDTNVILLSAGTGGPLVQAMRRAGLIAENHAVPGPGGHVIRTVARPFVGKANFIVISAGDADSLAKGVAAFAPQTDAETGEVFYDRFIVDSPGERWKKLRTWHYRVTDDKVWQKLTADLAQPYAGESSYSCKRAYVNRTAEYGNRYWLTGNDKWAEFFKKYLFKMEDDDLYGGKDDGKHGKDDSHMELYGLMRAWDRAEESPVFSTAERLRITNYLLRCIEGNQGFPFSFSGYDAYSGAVRMRHNHQTILACGLTQAYLYYWRLYGLGRAKMWKSWCDTIAAEGTF